MGLSPKLILLGLVAVIAIGVIGVVLAKTEAGGTSILSFCGTSIVVLLLMLQNTYQARDVTKRVEESDRKTDAKAEEVKADLRKATNAQAKKLEDLKEKVETVVKQTNGPLTKNLEDLKDAVNEVKDKLPEPPASPSR